MSMLIEFIGFFAALCTTIAFVPQVLLIVKTKDTRAISLPMYFVFNIGILSWLIYGVANVQWPLIVANSITLCLGLIILGLKLKHK